jgi:hypothetical protein
VTASSTTSFDRTSVLRQVVVQQDDLASGLTVQLIPEGDQVTDQVTLDLCSGSFPSERLRVARYQVGVRDAQQHGVLSTEAVLYGGAAATAQAFAELQQAQARCPSGFVPPVVQGEPPLKYEFHAAPDASWPQTPGVQRLAFDATVSDPQGDTREEVVSYLRRGALLVAVYFRQVSGFSVAGQSTPQGVTGVIAGRMARLPAPAVS